VTGKTKGKKSNVERWGACFLVSIYLRLSAVKCLWFYDLRFTIHGSSAESRLRGRASPVLLAVAKLMVSPTLALRHLKP
jgi:hypothetical protein